MNRGLSEQLKLDLERKIVLLSGPRQVGKTTLARSLWQRHDYINYDDPGHRVLIKDRSWDRKSPLVIFDELHKMRRFKAWLKGVYDVEGVRPRLLVTGSARLDIVRKVGDSLAGRYLPHRLHPFDCKEVSTQMEPEAAFARLMTVGGFPEPFLENDQRFAARWRRTHLDIILRQDLIELTAVRDIQTIETLVELLRRRVGSPVAHANLARDLDVAPKTVTRWLALLEELYLLFSLRPHSSKVSRTLHKMRKYYFYDTGQVLGDDGARLENVVACALLKEVHKQQDSAGKELELRYLRTREGREVDFVVCEVGKPRWLIEVKHSSTGRAASLVWAKARFPHARALQVAHQLDRERTWPDGIELRAVMPWLAELDLA